MKYVLLLAIVVSCAHKQAAKPKVYVVNVDAYKDEQAKPLQKFAIFSGMEAVNENDLQFKEFAKMTSNALEATSFQPVAPKEADVYVYLSYGIGDREVTTHTRRVPVYNWGSDAANVYNSWGQKVGSVDVDTPAVQYRSHVYSRVNYTRRARITAYKANKGQKGDMLWEVQLSSTGPTNNLREVFPFMLLGGWGYFETNSTNEVLVEANDPYLHKITGLLSK